MNKRKREEELIDQLDAYIDRATDADGGCGGARPPEAPIVDALRLNASSVEPSREFVEGLSNRLRRESTQSSSWLPRWVPGGAPIRRAFGGDLTRKAAVAICAAAGLLLAIVLPMVFDGQQPPPPLPRLVHAAEGDPQSASPTLLKGANLTLVTDLPEAPAEMRVYFARRVPIPDTPEEALAVARDFGLSEPLVYRSPDAEDRLSVIGEEDRVLGFVETDGWREVRYYTLVAGDCAGEASVADGTARYSTPLSLEQATDAAVAFLRQHHILPAAHAIHDGYRVSDMTDPAVEPDRWLYFVPELDDALVIGPHFTMVTVDPTGRVTGVVWGDPTAFDAGPVYPIKSAEEAYGELADGKETQGPFHLEIEGYYPIPAARPPSQVYRPLPPDWSVDQQITVTGFLREKLVPVDEGAVRAQLKTRDDIGYDLTGPKVADIVGADPGDVEIEGTIVSQLGPRSWRLEVTDWRAVPGLGFERLTGVLSIEEGEGWLVTDEDERHRLPRLPKGIDDGERVQVLADEPTVVGEDLDWWLIHSPPPSETDARSAAHRSSLGRPGEELLVESVQLAYFAGSSASPEPVVQPVWMFEGRNAEGTARFVAYVQAAVDEVVEDTGGASSATTSSTR